MRSLCEQNNVKILKYWITAQQYNVLISCQTDLANQQFLWYEE